jgi:hypothetical protein
MLYTISNTVQKPQYTEQRHEAYVRKIPLSFEIPCLHSFPVTMLRCMFLPKNEHTKGGSERSVVLGYQTATCLHPAAHILP